MSNGRALEEGAIIAENAAAANGDARGLALLNIPAGGSVPTAAGAPIPAPAPGTYFHYNPMFKLYIFLAKTVINCQLQYYRCKLQIFLKTTVKF